VREDAEFPDGSLIVGLPARSVASGDPDDTETTRMAAASSVGNGRRFLADLKPIKD